MNEILRILPPGSSFMLNFRHGNKHVMLDSGGGYATGNSKPKNPRRRCEECIGMFAPGRKDTRFCSDACRSRHNKRSKAAPAGGLFT